MCTKCTEKWQSTLLVGFVLLKIKRFNILFKKKNNRQF